MLHNWIEDLNLRCGQLWQIGLFGSIFFVGHVIGTTLLSEYGDTIGRIPMIRLGQGITLACYLAIVFFTRNILVIYMLIFIIGMLSCCRCNLAFIYGQEILAESRQNIGGCFFNLFDATVMIFSSFFIVYVSTNWVHLHSLFLVVIAFSLSVFCALPESPKYLAQREAFDDAISAYNTIARFNRTRQLDRVFERLRGQKRRDRRAFKWWVADAKRR